MKKSEVKPDHKRLIQDCIILHDKLMRAGLYATGQRMHEVVRSIGYEVADQIQKVK